MVGKYSKNLLNKQATKISMFKLIISYIQNTILGIFIYAILFLKSYCILFFYMLVFRPSRDENKSRRK